ncbi:MAG TPA: glycosyltransferase family 4 protein [Aquimonas sp.]|nr:glycosyltransferase family 4 protein [Aquimonas sp.]HRF53738.1 glycosyltransferase family 4 protein [Aquimonas sp.]
MTASLRILVMTDEMEVGGSQRQIVHLLRGLKARGHEVSLLYFRKHSFLLDAVRAEGIAVTQIEKLKPIDLRFTWALLRFLQRGRFDVVHCFSITAELWTRLVMPLVWGTRFISSVRGLGLDFPDWHWRAKAWVMRGSDAVISNSRAGAELMQARCQFPAARIDVVHNGAALATDISAARREQARQTVEWVSPQRMRLLFVGRLVYNKNVRMLLLALARLPAERRPLAWIAGFGPDRGDLLILRERLELSEDVRFLDERDDTAELMLAADLLVLPSREEGLSNVIIEAMGSGLPIIATAVGGTPELIRDGENGLLVPNEDDSALAAAMQRLIDDDALRDRLAAQARADALTGFSLDAMVDHTVSIYQRCLHGGKP